MHRLKRALGIIRKPTPTLCGGKTPVVQALPGSANFIGLFFSLDREIVETLDC